MAGYIIQNREQTVVLPAGQVDALLQAADGDAALLYLCLMRADAGVTPEQLMHRLHMSALRLQAAQSKLERMGLIRAAVSLPTPEPGREKPDYTAEEIGTMLRDPEFKMLVEETERCLGKKLVVSDLKRLAALHHEAGLPADVIFLLVRHCVETQELRHGAGRRPAMYQVEQEGYYWAKCGIFDQEAAARYLRTVSLRREKMGEYMAALQLGDRRPVKEEERYIGQWMDWGFSPEMVALAYEKTVLKKQEMNWRYCNGILSRWNRDGLHTVASVNAEKRPPVKPAQKKKDSIEEYMKW